MEEQRITTRYGLFTIPLTNDLICNSLRAYGEWAQIEIEFLASFIKTGDTVIDVGACFGTHTRAFSKFIGEEGKVYSIEANPKNFKYLEQNAKLSPNENIVTLNMAASSKSGEMLSLIEQTSNLGGSAVSAKTTHKEELIETVCIDDLRISKVSLIKIDVEGFEPAVIAGANKTIAESRPAVFCELNDVANGYKIVSEWIHANYSIFGIRTPASNPSAFRKGAPWSKLFGNNSECALLLIPNERESELESKVSNTFVIRITSIEDIVTLMLGQKQYQEIKAADNGVRTTLTDLLAIKPTDSIKEKYFKLLSKLKKKIREAGRLIDYIFVTAISGVINPFSKKKSRKLRRSLAERYPNKYCFPGAPIEAIPYEETTERGDLKRPEEPTITEWDSIVLSNGIVADHPRIDVVIPVYNGHHETLRCLYSVISQPQTVPFRIIVINDCSPLQGLVEKLKYLESRSFIELRSNKENLGFVQTCNIGMQLHESRDVVLLNSDTVVYSNWLDRLYEHTKNSTIGTITPLSNNATICSYPKFLSENNSELEVSHREIDNLASRYLDKQTIDIPTGVGFCLYITRKCIEKVGLFDEKNFGKGYGEENDFCMRARNAGFINTMAANIYITHWGSISFAKSAGPRKKTATAVINKLYPSYQSLVKDFIKSNNTLEIRRTIDIERLRLRINASRNGSILFFTHGRGGGTETHTSIMSEKLEQQGITVLFCRPHPSYNNKICIFDKKAGAMPNLPTFNPSTETKKIGEFIKYLGIRLIHIHHLIDMNTDMPLQIQLIAKNAGIPYDFTIHDYYSICPRVNLVDRSGFYCGEPDNKGCMNCLNSDSNTANIQIEEWRREYENLLTNARKVFAPNKDVADRLLKYFNGLQITVHPHILEHKNINTQIPLNMGIIKRRRRIALIGSIGSIKGSKIFYKTAEAAKRLGIEIEFHVIGSTNINSKLEKLENVHLLGAYKEGEAVSRIAAAKVDLAWFPSVCPETFCFTLSEAIYAGIFPVAFNIGAPANRLREYSWGAVMSLDLISKPNDIATFLASVPITPKPANIDNQGVTYLANELFSSYYEL
jgi:FkbM family methyltransferase